VLAGLWPFGYGTVNTPKDWRALFLPQRPYLPLGTLRSVLCYPERPEAFDDETCREALEDCLLGHLAGRLDETGNWSLALSVGEQQRLAFARALLLKPDWIFIDEGTSGLDHASESHIYAQLAQKLKGTTILSIAHRPEVAGLHDRNLHIDPTVLSIGEKVGGDALQPA
jgi:vitamin B12/bleomycin/antimicrobial peptide transport system ATP-binding/permease protein